MRIGFFSPTLNRIGGGEWVTLNMIHALKSRNYEVVVYSAEKVNSHHIKEFFGQPLDFTEVNFKPHFFDPYSLESIYPNILRSLLLRFRCDLLVDTFSNDTLPWVNAVYFNGLPKSLRLPKSLKGNLFLPYKALVRDYLKVDRFRDRILMSCSKYNARIIEDYLELPVKVLYPPVSSFFRLQNIKNNPKDNTVVSVTRISEDKKPDTIVRIARLTEKKIKFLIIGSCKLSYERNVLTRLQRLIRKFKLEKRIKIALNIPRNKQKEILQQSKVYLHPFVQYEAFGVSVIEAMLAGCVPVVPNVAGLREVVPKKWRYSSAEEAAAMINELIENWSEQKMKKSIKIAEKFNQERFCKEFLRIMEL